MSGNEESLVENTVKTMEADVTSILRASGTTQSCRVYIPEQLKKETNKLVSEAIQDKRERGNEPWCEGAKPLQKDSVYWEGQWIFEVHQEKWVQNGESIKSNPF